ncbi:hypothetical protein ED208_10405 [Stagnimonas aquatica]|uniref:MobA/MobL protein domain-containing protein n=1 Tax=Stagnimonas aquatica TaxID=2689987 RepID=A0A3N0VA99_9GAMM|nr:MobA/MobL family protein [Stagnimonas aquatica]ROH89534.1 hypothetical protein ED208_10405 [Stagnimonas aquatica]
MAIYRCSLSTFSRAKGHSSVKAAAYRARTTLLDTVSGKTSNYSNRGGLAANLMFFPKGEMPAWCKDLQAFWNEAEKAETRVNSTVAREFLIALPHEMDDQQRLALTQEITRNLVDRFGFAAMVSIHHPDKDDKNEHVHILTTTRKLEKTGFTAKVRELDMRSKAVEEVREMVANTINKHLEKGGYEARVDHRTLEAQLEEATEKQDIKKIIELDREPVPHVFRGKNQQKYEEKRQKVIEKNQKRYEKNIRQFLVATAEDAQNRSNIIQQLKAKQDKTEEQIKTAIKAYDYLSELVQTKGASKALQLDLAFLSPLEKSIFFDVNFSHNRLPPDKLEKVQVLKERTLNEAEKLTVIQQDTSQHLKTHKAEGQKEAGLLHWLTHQAKENGIRFELKDQKPFVPEPFKPNGVLSGIENLISKMEHRKTIEPMFQTDFEHCNIQQAKHQAASLPPSARAMVGNNLMARLASAASSVRALEGQLRTCKPEQRAELLGRIREADKELQAANRALDEAKSNALAAAAQEAEQARQMTARTSFIPELTLKLDAKDRR